MRLRKLKSLLGEIIELKKKVKYININISDII